MLPSPRAQRDSYVTRDGLRAALGSGEEAHRDAALLELGNPQRHHARPPSCISLVAKDYWGNTQVGSTATSAAKAMRALSRALSCERAARGARQAQLDHAQNTARPNDIAHQLRLRRTREATSSAQSESYWNQSICPPPASIGNVHKFLDDLKHGRVSLESQPEPERRISKKRAPPPAPSTDPVDVMARTASRRKFAALRVKPFVADLAGFLVSATEKPLEKTNERQQTKQGKRPQSKRDAPGPTKKKRNTALPRSIQTQKGEYERPYKETNRGKRAWSKSEERGE